MSEVDLLQHQRELLHSFRQSAIEFAKVEDQAAAQLAMANEAFEETQAALRKLDLEYLPRQIEPLSPRKRQAAAPSQELAHSVSIAVGAAEKTKAGLEDLRHWRERQRRLRKRLRVAGGLVGLVGLIAVLIFILWGVQPCGWLDSRIGHLSGCSYRLSGHEGAIQKVSYSPDGKILATASSDGTIRLWDPESRRVLRILSGHNDIVGDAVFSPDGRLLVSSGFDGMIKIWDVATGEELRILGETSRSVSNLAFASSTETLAFDTDYDVTLLDLNSGRKLRTISESARVGSIAFSPDGETLAVGSWYPPAVKLWDVSNGVEVRSFEGHTNGVVSLAFSPDDQILASGEWVLGTIKLWNVVTGQELHTLTNHTGPVESVAFSPDGKFLASGGTDGMVRLWNVDDGREIRHIRHAGLWGTVLLSNDIGSVTFSPDGDFLISGGLDGMVRAWRLSKQ